MCSDPIAAMSPLEAVQLLRDLKAEQWTSDDWRLFWDQMELAEDVADRLQEMWNDGYEIGKEDGERTRQEADFDDGHTDGYIDGVKEGRRLAKEEFAKSITTTITKADK